EIIVRTFYAMHDTRTPVYVGVGAVLMNIVLGWTFLRLGLGLGGLALAFSMANIAETITLLALLSGQLGALGSAFWHAIGRMALAALAFGAALLGALRLSEAVLPFLRSGDTYHWPADFPALVAWLAVVCSAGTAIYLGGAAALGVEEVQTLVGKIAALGRRFKHS
ncbi:MAG TPA: lipid II flippase MurJ, partial [Roseiflexaceae bacterium]